MDDRLFFVWPTAIESPRETTGKKSKSESVSDGCGEKKNWSATTVITAAAAATANVTGNVGHLLR